MGGSGAERIAAVIFIGLRRGWWNVAARTRASHPLLATPDWLP
jgi:hypothetical protein